MMFKVVDLTLAVFSLFRGAFEGAGPIFQSKSKGNAKIKKSYSDLTS
jgi:hypothetical protein